MNYYAILKIERNATPDEIKKAYKKLILENHPDKLPPQKREIYNKLSEKKSKGDLLSESELKESQDLVMPFLKIQKAYELLSDPEKRRLYDESNCQENTVKLDDLFEDYIRKEPYHFLYQSIFAGNLESVRKIVEELDININAKYDYVYIDITPIDCAIKEDHDKIVDYLISKGAEICLTDSLRLAIKLNSYKTAKLLLNKCDVNSINTQDNNGNTVLHDFFKYFNKPNNDDFIIKSFNSDSYSFFNFSQPTSKDSSRSDVKENAQSSAVICNTSRFERSTMRSLDPIKSPLNLMESREDRARDSVITTLEKAIPLVHSFIDKGVCYDIQNNEYETSLDMCIDQFIENHKAKISKKKQKDGALGVLYYDCVEKEKAYYSIINIFVEKGITGLKYRNKVPISHKIIEYNIYPHIENKAKVDLLEVDSNNKRALDCVVKKHCNISIIKSFVENGIDLNIPNSLGQTLLHHVVLAYCDRIEQADYTHELEEVNTRFSPMLEALVKAGANLNVTNSSEQTLLHSVVLAYCSKVEKANCYDPKLKEINSCFIHMLETLVKAGANLNVTNSSEQTLLYHIVLAYCDNIKQADYTHQLKKVKACFSTMLEALVKAGVDTNITDSSGRSLLHHVVLAYCDEVGKADYTHEFKEISECFIPMLETLVKAGADIEAKDKYGKCPVDLLKERCQSMKGGYYYSAKQKIENLDKAKNLLKVKSEIEVLPVAESIGSTFVDNSNIEAEKEIQNKPKNIQHNKLTIYFTAAAVFSTLIIATAFLTQTYTILAALIIPAIIGLYGWSLQNESKKPDSKLQNSDIETTKASGRVATTS